jgi:ABC-type multidrug transport system permease subunit
MKSTLGEILFATVLAGVAAALAAVLGFVGGIFLCGRLLSGEMTEWALIVGPALALLMAVGTFVLLFWKIIRYGAPDSLPSSK